MVMGQFVSEWLIPMGIGIGGGVFFQLWRMFSGRWDKWFPLLMHMAKWVLYGIALALAGGVIWAGLSSSRPLMSLGAVAVGLIFFMVVKKFAGDSGASSGGGGATDHHERGARVATVKQVAAQVKAAKSATGVVLGGVPLPVDSEPYHMMVSGSTGSGKSVAINTLLDFIRVRGDTAIIVDSGGDFLVRHWKDGDKVLNPYDDRCALWSPTMEMQGPWDAQALARSIVPDGTGDSKEWNGYAQTLITCCLQKLFEQNRKGIRDLMYYVQVAPVDELRVLLAGTAAMSQLESDKTFGSIRTIASKYLSTYGYLPPEEADFSVSGFVQAQAGNFLYLTYRDDQLDSVRELISCVLDVASRAILSLKPDKRRRVWLIIDEFASIGKVQSIEAVATKARKAGGCLVIGVQSVSQLRDRYGNEGAQTILSCLSTWLVLRCSDGDTAEYMSKFLGEEEVLRKTGGSSRSVDGGSQSTNESIASRRIVMPAELQQLPNCVGYYKIHGNYPVCKVSLSFPPNKSSGEAGFDARDFATRPMMDLSVAPVAPSAKPEPVATAKIGTFHEPAPVKAAATTAKTGAPVAKEAPKAPPQDYVILSYKEKVAAMEQEFLAAEKAGDEVAMRLIAERMDRMVTDLHRKAGKSGEDKSGEGEGGGRQAVPAAPARLSPAAEGMLERMRSLISLIRRELQAGPGRDRQLIASWRSEVAQLALALGDAADVLANDIEAMHREVNTLDTSEALGIGLEIDGNVPGR